MAALGFATAFYSPVERRFLAVRLLSQMKSEDRDSPSSPGRTITDLQLGDGTRVPAKIYGPAAEKARLSIVLGHGIHHLGIEEPRLVRFANHLAKLGYRVFTPELSDLKEYRISPQGVSVLKAGVDYLGKDAEEVGLIGFSFGGGLALLAAEDASTASQLRYVASIGGFHDLARTLRFLATNEVEGPSGRSPRSAHEYGLLVLLVGHLDKFSLGEDEDRLREALLAWLKEDRSTARAQGHGLSNVRAARLFQLLEEQRLSELAPELLPIIEAEQEALAALSPTGRLANVRTKILLLHGSEDDVVPPEETLFAEQELKRSASSGYRALVTPLLEHVRVDRPAGLTEKWKLIALISELL